MASAQQARRTEEPRTSRARLKVVDPSQAERRGLIKEFVEELPDTFLQCREMGHNWRPFTASRYRDGGFLRVLRCSRCYCKKEQDLSSTGMILSTQYKHPEGYLIHGVGQLVGEERGTLRLESVTRIIRDIDAKAKKKGK